MSTSAKNKFLTWAVILLLLANTATIAYFWLYRKGPADHPRQGQGSAAAFLTGELALDAQQQKAYEELVRLHRLAAHPLRDSIRIARDAFFDLLKRDKVSDSALQAAGRAVGDITGRLDLITFDHFRKVRVLCTDSQKIKFDSLLHRVLRMMGEPGPGGKPPQGGRPPQGGKPPGNPPPPDADRPPMDDGPPPGEGGPPPGTSHPRR